MSHTVPTQHPAVVLRSNYEHLRALFAIAVAGILGLTAAVVVLATNSNHGTLARPTTQSASRANPSAETGAKLDHSGRGATAADRLATYPDAPPPSTSDQVRAPIQSPAAQLGFNRGSVGQTLAAQLGFNRGSVGQTLAAQLGFNRGSVGRAPAVQLGFDPRPVSQARRSSILSLAAISAGKTAAASGIAGAVPSTGSGLAWGSIPKPDRIAAERAAANESASLDRFALIHVRAIPRPRRSTPTPMSKPQPSQPRASAGASNRAPKYWCEPEKFCIRIR